MLQYVAAAVCCSVLQLAVNVQHMYDRTAFHWLVSTPGALGVTVCCSVLQCVAVCCSVLPRVELNVQHTYEHTSFRLLVPTTDMGWLRLVGSIKF